MLLSFDLQRVTESVLMLCGLIISPMKRNNSVCFQRQVSLSVGENLPAGAEVGTIAAYDADQAGPIYYYIQSKCLLIKVKIKVFNGIAGCSKTCLKSLCRSPLTWQLLAKRAFEY